MSNELIKNVFQIKQECLIWLKLDIQQQILTTWSDRKLSFREAYKISSKIVNYAERKKKNLDKLTLEEIRKFHKNLNNNVLKIFNVKNSMNSKNSYGGTSERNVKNMIKKYKKELK